MKYVLIGASVLLLAGLAAYFAFFQTPPLTPDDQAIEAIVEEAMKEWQVPGAAVAVVRDDEIVLLKGFGVKKIGENQKVTPDTVFPIASCTKAFTTAAMAILVDEKRMSWDDPVRKHLPFFRLSEPAANELVSLRDLVCHRTGVGPHELLWYQAPWGPEEAVRRIGHVPLKYPFRSGFEYQTTMFTAAGLAVSRASGEPWHEFVARRLFKPLRMSRSSFTTKDALASGDYASPHRFNEAGEVAVASCYTFTGPEPAGSIHSCARDLAHWVRFQLDEGEFDGQRLISKENFAVLHAAHNVVPMTDFVRALNPETVQVNYAMGWVVQDYRGYRLVLHGGAIDGFRAHICLVPSKKIGIVILSNLHDTYMNLAVSNAIVDRLLGLQPLEWNSYLRSVIKKRDREANDRKQRLERLRVRGSKPPVPLANLAGIYEHPAYGQAKVRIASGRLWFHWHHFEVPLEHIQATVFLAKHKLIDSEVEFVLAFDRQVTAMKMSAPFEVEFKRSR
ncbi:MAG: penicillin-binding protein [Gemmatales bacterium]|nr:MAG: penicillin-binding protein [Gemmatales bacterium]